jgi:hypothetical protein
MRHLEIVFSRKGAKAQRRKGRPSVSGGLPLRLCPFAGEILFLTLPLSFRQDDGFGLREVSPRERHELLHDW